MVILRRGLLILLGLILKVSLFAGMVLSPMNFELDLSKTGIQTYTIMNVGRGTATYQVNLQDNDELLKFVSMGAQEFKLNSGEKKEIRLAIRNRPRTENREYRGKLNIKEIVESDGVSYEINTAVNLYGYTGKIDEVFKVDTILFNDKGFSGTIENLSQRRIEILMLGDGEDGKNIFATKIKIRKNEKYNLSEMDIKENLKIKKLTISSNDMKEVIEF